MAESGLTFGEELLKRLGELKAGFDGLPHGDEVIEAVDLIRNFLQENQEKGWVALNIAVALAAAADPTYLSKITLLYDQMREAA